MFGMIFVSNLVNFSCILQTRGTIGFSKGEFSRHEKRERESGETIRTWRTERSRSMICSCSWGSRQLMRRPFSGRLTHDLPKNPSSFLPPQLLFPNKTITAMRGSIF